MTSRSFLALLLLAGSLLGCSANVTGASSDDRGLQAENLEQSDAEAQRLWAAYVADETAGKELQADCVPRYLPAANGAPKRGMLMFFHGFTACPQQYFDIGAQLQAEGFDVYLPLLPGHGRTPTYDGYGMFQEKDNLDDLPNLANGAEYAVDGDQVNDRHEAFVARMNEIAALAEAPVKVIAGLSGGGSLATGAALSGKGIWDRALLYAPYYKNPKLNGPLSALLGTVTPGFLNDWGDDCREVRAAGRHGYCSVPYGAIRAMTDYGVWAASRIGDLDIPVQFVGVDHDPTADNAAIVGAYRRSLDASLCLYYHGVPHSIINPKDDAPKVDPRWVPAMQADSVGFITEGHWFGTDGKSSETNYELDACRI